MTPTFWVSLEFCALARPGPSRMNSDSVDRQVSSMLDSEFFNWLGWVWQQFKNEDFSRKCRDLKKKWRFHEKVEISWTSRDFMKKLRFHEKVKISWKSHDFIKQLRFHEKIEISWKSWDFMKKLWFEEKIDISWKSKDFMRKSRFHEKVEISWKVEIGPVRVQRGEGSTCPSRGKLWLTVYRAHASDF